MENWSRGLVKYSSDSGAAFPDSTITATARIITRPLQPGFKFLDAKRAPVIRIQPSVSAFSSAFTKLTDNLLNGLDWDNIFVAGGIILGSLLCTEDPDATAKAEDFITSDIDMYLYGLSVTAANKKLEHIFEVFKRNLPTNTPVLVIRNSKTISFVSRYPLKRLQVVLKLTKNPKEVLLNFDLDICSMGWDGKDLYLLPRAARALESQFSPHRGCTQAETFPKAGYNVFTMSLVQGHYLGQRRASQEQR